MTRRRVNPAPNTEHRSYDPTPLTLRQEAPGTRPASPQAPVPSPKRMIDLGDDLGPEESSAPAAAAIDAYTHAWDMKESIFRDEEYARSLGFRGRVVPGPMMTARIEHFLRRSLAEWAIERLSTTFRLPTIAGERVTFRGTVTEVHSTERGTRLVCDVFVENSDGERSVVGVATFHRQGSAAEE